MDSWVVLEYNRYKMRFRTKQSQKKIKKYYSTTHYFQFVLLNTLNTFCVIHVTQKYTPNITKFICIEVVTNVVWNDKPLFEDRKNFPQKLY